MDETADTISEPLSVDRPETDPDSLAWKLARTNVHLQLQIENWIRLNDIAGIITSTLDEPEISRRVMENVTRILKVQACSLMLLDRKTNELVFVVTLEGDAADYSSFRLKLGQGIAGWVAQKGQPLLIPDVHQDPRFYSKVDEATGFQSRSILCVPIKARDRTIGVMEAINKIDHPDAPVFSQEDLAMLTTLASWVAIAVENAWFNRAAKKAAVETTLRQTVTAIAHHINNRLMGLSLELDDLENEGPPDAAVVKAVASRARRSIDEVSAVIKALDRLEEVRTVPYISQWEMIDIENELKEELSHIEAHYGKEP